MTQSRIRARAWSAALRTGRLRVGLPVLEMSLVLGNGPWPVESAWSLTGWSVSLVMESSSTWLLRISRGKMCCRGLRMILEVPSLMWPLDKHPGLRHQYHTQDLLFSQASTDLSGVPHHKQSLCRLFGQCKYCHASHMIGGTHAVQAFQRFQKCFITRDRWLSLWVSPSGE